MVRERNTEWLDETIREAAPGPPPKADFNAWRAAHADALEALQRQAREKPQRGQSAAVEFARHLMLHPAATLAAAAGVLILVAVGIYGLNLSLDGTSRAFADVCRSVGQSSTIQFDTAFGRPGGEKFTGHTYEKNGYLMRDELHHGDARAAWDTILRDRRSDRTLYLDTRGKRAWHPGPRLRWDDAGTNLYEFFSSFHSTSGYSVKELGEGRVDGRTVVGFRLSKTDGPFAGLESSIWADPQTMRPVRIDTRYPVPHVGIVEQAITNIVFDKPLDDSLFDFEASGYQIDPPLPAPGESRP
jgi:hypothetical protein